MDANEDIIGPGLGPLHLDHLQDFRPAEVLERDRLH
jgi:hypothetical protein